MDLPQKINPYEKHRVMNYQNYNYISNELTREQNIPYNFQAIPSFALNYTEAGTSHKETRYKKNITSSANEVERLIEASKPSYIVGQYPLTDHNDIKRRIDPENMYASIGYGN